MELDELNRLLRAEMDLINNQPIEEFEGRTPTEMNYLLHYPFDEDSPMKFKENAAAEIFDKIPMLQMVVFFLNLIQKEQTIKLTQKGNLPLKVLRAIYDLRLRPSEYIDSGMTTIRSEEGYTTAHCMRLLCELLGFVKKRKGKMTLTAKGRKAIKTANHYMLFKDLFTCYTTGFNWAYNDYYADEVIGQMGFAFSLELLSKYGAIEREDVFYTEKYFKAFPKMIEDMEEPLYGNKERNAFASYSHRTFYNFMWMFGMAEVIEKGEDMLRKKRFIKKTPSLDQLIVFEE